MTNSMHYYIACYGTTGTMVELKTSFMEIRLHAVLRHETIFDQRLASSSLSIRRSTDYVSPTSQF